MKPLHHCKPEPSALPDLVALVGYGLLAFAVVGIAMRWLV
jgi:hypothetical protein